MGPILRYAATLIFRSRARLRPGPVYFWRRTGGGLGLPRGACVYRRCAAFSGARRPMAMHVHAYARIRPRLDFSCPGQHAERGGFGMPPPQCGGGAPGRRALGRAWPLRCTIPINQRRSWCTCIASIAIPILNNPVFWDEDVLSAVFNRRRILMNFGATNFYYGK